MTTHKWSDVKKGMAKPKLPRVPIPKPTKVIPNKKSAKIAEQERKEAQALARDRAERFSFDEPQYLAWGSRD